jgi:CHAD domain-containing protein
MRNALAQARPGAWLLAFQRWLLQHGWRAVPDAQRFAQLSPLDAWACRALAKGHRLVVRDARSFGKLAPAQRHLLRIAIKRQRYAAEFFQTLFSGKRQTRYLTALRLAQDGLGQANDAHIAWSLLTSWAAPSDSAPVRDFALGWLAVKQAAAANGETAGLVRDILKSKRYW